MRCGSTFMRDYFYLYSKKARSSRVWSFFSFLKILKNAFFNDQKTKTPFFFEFLGFGHNSTSNNSVDQCGIFLKPSF